MVWPVLPIWPVWPISKSHLVHFVSTGSRNERLTRRKKAPCVFIRYRGKDAGCKGRLYSGLIYVFPWSQGSCNDGMWSSLLVGLSPLRAL